MDNFYFLVTLGVLILGSLALGVLITTSLEYDRGCEASAFQASKNGFSLEENLAVCKKIK